MTARSIRIGFGFGPKRLSANRGLIQVHSTNTSLVKPGVFPLSVSSDSRTMVDVKGNPFPLLGRTLWNVVSLPKLGTSGWKQLLDDTVAKDFTVIEWRHACHSSSQDNNPPFDGDGNLPFLKQLNGTTYTGSLTYANINNNAPDFSTPNDAYFANVIAITQYCATLGIQVHFFPSYMGYPGTDQGWDLEMQANGATKMQSYGSYIASKLSVCNNITWMLLGDQGGSLSSGQKTVLNALHTGINLTGRLISSEGTSPSISTDQTDYGSLITVNGAYAFEGVTGFQTRRAYTHGGMPAFLDEGPYDEEGSDGDNFNSNASQPVRRFNWWAVMGSIGGYCTGNAYVWRCQSGYISHMNTQGAQDLAKLNAFWKSIPFQRLVPDGLGTIGTLITAGGGTQDTSNCAVAAATPLGDLLVAYLSPSHSGSVTIDMTKLRGTVTARWFDPTSAAYTTIGTFANTGTHAFTPTGNNSVGQGDWVLRLDA